MKKLSLLFSSLFASLGALFSQVSPFAEVPDSLNPFTEIDVPTKPYLVDFDSDGFDEVILIKYHEQKVELSFFQNDGTGVLEELDSILNPLNVLYSFYQFEIQPDIDIYYDLDFADLDSDGDTDFLLNTSSYTIYDYYGSHYIDFFINDGSNDFELVSRSEIGLPGNASTGKFTDLDENGDLEILYTEEDKYGGIDPTFSETFNQISQMFEGAQLESETLSSRLDFFDIDKDGDEDHFTYILNDPQLGAHIAYREKIGPNLFGDTIPFIESNEDFALENFGTSQVLSLTSRFSLGDIDDDDALDFIIFDQDLNKIRLFEQVGTEVIVECEPSNFMDAPSGLESWQNPSGFRRLRWDHYSDVSQGCIINGGIISELNPNAPFIQTPVHVLLQGHYIDGQPFNTDRSGLLEPDQIIHLFNPITYTFEGVGQMIPGAFYKWRVRCGCLVNPNLDMPELVSSENVILSPWSDYDTFTNFELTPEIENISEIGLIQKNAQLEVFPNPITNEFKLTWRDQEKPLKVEVMNQLGEQVLLEAIDMNNEFGIRLNSSSWSQGAYIILVHFQDEISVAKVLK